MTTIVDANSDKSQGISASSAGIISSWESEQFVTHLEVLPLSEYGGPKWRRTHEWVEKLNLQAHHNVATKREEFVMDQFLTHGKAPVLVANLLAAEVWKEKVYPLVKEKLQKSPSIMSYTLLYHELSLVNLLECLMYHKEVIESLGKTDALFELVDYCYRKMVRLASTSALYQPSELRPAASAASVEAAVASSSSSSAFLEDGSEQMAQIEFSVCMISLSLFRFITDQIHTVPLSVSTRILNTNDMIGTLVVLVERQRWLTKGKGKYFKWTEGKWMNVAPQELRRLCQAEAQVWLSLNNLLTDPEARKKYDYDSHRKEVIARLRGYFNDALIDQVPPLVGLQRAVEEVQLLNAPEAAHRQGLVIEQVPVMRESILREDLNNSVKTIVDYIDKQTDEDIKKEMMIFSSLYSAEALEDVLERPICAHCGKLAVKRCSRCRMDWYCGRECQVNAWKKHKTVCDILCVKPSATEQR